MMEQMQSVPRALSSGRSICLADDAALGQCRQPESLQCFCPTHLAVMSLTGSCEKAAQVAGWAKAYSKDASSYPTRTESPSPSGKRASVSFDNHMPSNSWAFLPARFRTCRPEMQCCRNLFAHPACWLQAGQWSDKHHKFAGWPAELPEWSEWVRTTVTNRLRM